MFAKVVSGFDIVQVINNSDVVCKYGEFQDAPKDNVILVDFRFPYEEAKARQVRKAHKLT